MAGEEKDSQNGGRSAQASRALTLAYLILGEASRAELDSGWLEMTKMAVRECESSKLFAGQPLHGAIERLTLAVHDEAQLREATAGTEELRRMVRCFSLHQPARWGDGSPKATLTMLPRYVHHMFHRYSAIVLQEPTNVVHELFGAADLEASSVARDSRAAVFKEFPHTFWWLLSDVVQGNKWTEIFRVQGPFVDVATPRAALTILRRRPSFRTEGDLDRIDGIGESIPEFGSTGDLPVVCQCDHRFSEVIAYLMKRDADPMRFTPTPAPTPFGGMQEKRSVRRRSAPIATPAVPLKVQSSPRYSQSTASAASREDVPRAMFVRRSRVFVAFNSTFHKEDRNGADTARDHGQLPRCSSAADSSRCRPERPLSAQSARCYESRASGRIPSAERSCESPRDATGLRRPQSARSRCTPEAVESHASTVGSCSRLVSSLRKKVCSA
jgi:hypothetical protein